MAVRLVLCFQAKVACGEGDAASTLAIMLRDLSGRSAVRGGQVVAWHVDGVAFSFPVEALPDLTDMLPEPPCTQFGMGLAVGELETVFELGHGASASSGPALAEATALAVLAEPGEALVSTALASREPGLLAADEKAGSRWGRPWRGLRLNLAQPWLPAPADLLSRLDFDVWVGAAADAALPVQVGSCSVLVADEGSGGSRFLRQLVAAERSSLWLAPACAGEPLGALRRAFARNTDWSRPGAPGNAGRGALERLLSGAGLTHEAAIGLLRLWSATAGADGSAAIVVIDEADRVDLDTLETVSLAAPETFAVVARTHGPELPAALRSLSSCAEFELGRLDRQRSFELLGAFTRGGLRGALADRWARLCGHSPLGLQEALCCALEEGELVWTNDELCACRPGPSRGDEHEASYWIRRRLERFDAAERTVLEAVAVLGGEADSYELTSIADQALDRGKSLAEVTRQLVGRRWVRRTGERILGLSSATHRRVLLEALSAERRKQWHSLVAERVGSRDRPLSAGIAAVHALLAGEDERAEASARRAALLLRVNAREVTARAFDGLAEQLSLEPVRARGLGGVLPAPAEPDPNPAPGERGARSSEAARSSVESESSLEEGATEFDLDDWMPGWAEGTVATGQPSGGVPVSGSGEAAAATGPGFPARPCSPNGSFVRNATGRAGCRQRLAVSLLLARTERFVEALPHALEALAIARETGDARGEKACVAALAALSRAAGQPAAADAWEQRLRS
ncbi:MAG: hypothetical protein JW940_29225 [Polyangiaceae bacterium]|nr:hypothetical protein [Polyangiaceae bacterium]